MTDIKGFCRVGVFLGYKNNIRITKASDIRRLVNRIINELNDTDEPMTNERARTMATLANTALKAIEQSDIQERMEALEKKLEDREGNKW